MHRRAGFTLLEVLLAVAIALVLVLLAVPSVAGIMRGKRLERTEEQFDDLVRQAQYRSVNERRTYGLVWQKDGIELTPMETQEGLPAGEPLRLGLEDGQDYTLERTAALGKNPPGVWTFWRSGACEPVTITFKGPEGTWTAVYDPLTARRVSLSEQRP